MGPKKKPGKKKVTAVEESVESEYDTMDLEMLREVVPMLQQQLDKSMLDRNYVQLERDAIQQYYDITGREVSEVELAIIAKDREMELLEDNHRVELRVYQQKVKHLQYEHSNNIKDVTKDGMNWLDSESYSHDKREIDLLKMKEHLKFQKMEDELMNITKVTEIRQLHEKQLIKLRQQFDDGLTDLTHRHQTRLSALENDLELQCRVEIHEVEERKNQHINDLMRNHKKAFGQMKLYYNDITSGNLQLIKKLQAQVEELKTHAVHNKKSLIDYMEKNVKLSEPLSKVSAEIASVHALLKERAKDQMALRNAHARLISLTKATNTLKNIVKNQEEEYAKTELERDHLYHSYEESLRRIQQQSEFYNQSLHQLLQTAQSNSNKLSNQVNDLAVASGLDVTEMGTVLSNLADVIRDKDTVIGNMRFTLIKAKKTFNDCLAAVSMRLRELGVSEQDVLQLGYNWEVIPGESTTGPAGLINSL